VLPEVQALRALAVLLVVLFHFWPRRLPGGFVGVDVFFVISGFLISGHILRSLERGTFTFRSFYLRRARRLLPAACLVLAVTSAAVLAFMPYSTWRAPLTEALASTLYVQNWVLAWTGSDYFGGKGTAAQHYWSLSVEEQYYLFWPLSLLALWAWSRRARGAREASLRLLAGLAALTGASFVASVVMTRADAGTAYFATYTRMWEFGAGALLALQPRWRTHARLRGAVGWGGVALIVLSALLLDETTPFPGWAATAPVVGAVAVIAAGLVDRRWSTARLVRSAPIQFLGDVSYSLYLWHWPLIILVPAALAVTAGVMLKVGLLAVCVLLAWATAVLVEDRWRDHAVDAGQEAARSRARRANSATAGLLVLSLALAGGGLAVVVSRQSDARSREAQAVGDDLPCFGAAALSTPGCEPPFGAQWVPDLGSALAEFSRSPVHQDCFTDVLDADLLRCDEGPAKADVHIALLGDSHALQWYPALHEVAQAEGWRVSTFLRGSCPASTAVTVRPDRREQELCAAWSRRAIDAVATDPSLDLVVTTSKDNKAWVHEPGEDLFETAVEGFAAAWRRFAESGKRVVVVRDTPRPRENVLECLSRQDDPAHCGRSRADAEADTGNPLMGGREPMVAAVHAVSDPRVVLWDPSDQICSRERCEAVVGDVVVYVDESHLSTTYARTVAPALGGELRRVLA
jgi:peptidoglycan/LPS O-acetylase OafA/YrhL